MLQNFYVTFGMMYRYEKHPHWSGAHPDGWLWVQAEDEEQARALVAQYIGNAYAFMYDAARFEQKWHPLGCLAVISPAGATAAGPWVEAPTPLTPAEPLAGKTYTVSWNTTESFSATITVPEDFEGDEGDLDEWLLDHITESDYESPLSDAFEGCIDRTITDKEEQ